MSTASYLRPDAVTDRKSVTSLVKPKPIVMMKANTATRFGDSFQAAGPRFEDFEAQPGDESSGEEVQEMVGAEQVSTPIIERAGKSRYRQDQVGNDHPDHRTPLGQAESCP